tara:strand:+ start:474 stop:593 length:120 start_codon:yes stop_codon:yes gene_type:complete
MAQYTRQEFIYKEGGTITLDWAFAKQIKENKGIKTPFSD